jgi:hypothetical protein
MTGDDFKAELHHYLNEARAAFLWKLEGLSEYDLRRPLVPTGTNLLGLVKHVSNTEAGYFGAVFGRPCPDEQFPWPDENSPETQDNAHDDDPNIDMYAAADEPSQDVLDRYRRVMTFADTTIAELPLNAPGRVPWWRDDRRNVTLHKVLIHMIAELNRHLGHADIVRELIDGAAGHRAAADNLPDQDWAAYRNKLQTIADGFA